jgi:catechol 2,3-dioxygenase
MPRGVIDLEGLQSPEITALKEMRPPDDLPFNINKIGHVVVRVTDIERSVDFYTRVLGFRVSDAYPDSMMSGKMVFLRCNDDHHGLALIGGAQGESKGTEFHHMAFEVDTLDELVRARQHLKKNDVPIEFEGRRRAGAQIALEFCDPDGYGLEIYWGLDQISGDDDARPPEEWVEAFSLEEAIENAPVGQDTTLKSP